MPPRRLTIGRGAPPDRSVPLTLGRGAAYMIALRRPPPGAGTGSTALLQARWQSGYAEDCKSSYIGSIPVRASILNAQRDCILGVAVGSVVCRLGNNSGGSAAG